jgi:hypothetical protein
MSPKGVVADHRDVPQRAGQVRAQRETSERISCISECTARDSSLVRPSAAANVLPCSSATSAS